MHIHVKTDDIRNTKIAEQFHAVIAVSTLEHIPEFDAAVDGMMSLLAPEGTLTFPYTSDEYWAIVDTRHDADEMSKRFRYVCQLFCDANISAWRNKH